MYNNDLIDYSINTPLRNVTYYNGKLYQITSTGQRGSEIEMGMKCVKHGYVTASSNTSITVSVSALGFTNANDYTIILNGHSSGSNVFIPAVITAKTATQFTVSTASAGGAINYQILA